ncbi:hypothetical protein C8J57DRAFT_1216615 [Mycena rebaudengoi]|nr:hypothetical protein C8J57DRAFT_1216615 [Mycena rebaudengoi]
MAFFDSSRSYRDPKPDLRLKPRHSPQARPLGPGFGYNINRAVHPVSPDFDLRSISLVSSQSSKPSNESNSSIVGFGRKQHHRRRSLDCTAAYTKIKHADPATKKGYRKSLPNSITSSRPPLPVVPRRKLEYRLSLDQDCLSLVFEQHPLQERDTRVLVVGRLRRVSDDLWKAVRHPPKALVLPQMVNARRSLLGRARRFVLGQIRRRVASSRAAQISVSHYADFVSTRLGGLLVSRYPFLFPVILRLKPLKLACGSDATFPSASFETKSVRGIFRRLEDLFYRRIRNIAGF